MKRKGMSHSEAGKLGYRKSKNKLSLLNKNKARAIKKQLKGKKCLQCLKQLNSLSKKFCNTSCSASYNNVGNTKWRHSNCRSCGIPFVYYPSLIKHEVKCKGKKCLSCRSYFKSRKAIYCSNECYSRYKVEKSFSKLISNKNRKDNSPIIIKKYLLETEGNRCSICKGTKWNGKAMPLVLDHKNGNPEDNRLKNLRLVCGNCDMQLPTYKSKNRGNGRSYRRERYAQGKSY